MVKIIICSCVIVLLAACAGRDISPQVEPAPTQQGIATAPLSPSVGVSSSASPRPSASVLTISEYVTGVHSSTEFWIKGYTVLYQESAVAPQNGVIRYDDLVTVVGSVASPTVISATSVTILKTPPSPSPSATPRPSPTAVATGPYHIATWAYDIWGSQGGSASTSDVTRLLTYAEGNKAPSDCHSGAPGCKAVFYLRPNQIVDSSTSSCVTHPDADILAAASESWFIHNTGYTTSAYRIFGPVTLGGSVCTMWAMDLGSAGVQSWWLSYLQSHANDFDLNFIDGNTMDIKYEYSYSNGGGCIPRPTFCYSTQEIPDDAALVAHRVSFVNAMTYTDGRPMHFVYQQAYPWRTQTYDISAIASTNNIDGVTCEGCIANSHAIVVPHNYGPYLDEMAAINATHGAFIMISDGNAPAGSATQILQRLVTTGVAWLGYSEGHTIVDPNLEYNTHSLAVWPEDLIYPSVPLQTMSSGSADLQVASGVWRREFTTCYQAGVFFGRCAAIVNSNTSDLAVQSSWLTQTYKHVITLSGGDVLSGGTANLGSASFTPNVTTVPAEGALLLAQ